LHFYSYRPGSFQTCAGQSDTSHLELDGGRCPSTAEATIATRQTETTKEEKPGRYYHPLLASLITGAARLMLAITERLVLDKGLEWAFCDTDSMAIAKPRTMKGTDFHPRVDDIVRWFENLNPYSFAGSILKIEDENFGITTPNELVPLHCWAISAKRYALFNLDKRGRPVLRKASAHGLGHLIAPYTEKNPADGIPKPAFPVSKLVERIGVGLWQHDFWIKIIEAALSGNPDCVDLNYHPALKNPAASQYAATTPRQLRLFREFNRNLPYDQQVRPRGFLLSAFADSFSTTGKIRGKTQQPEQLRPIAPFDRNTRKALERAFDRVTGAPIRIGQLKSYRQELAQYHLHPESKFLNADYIDRGLTRRRHVHVQAIRYIGKEANHWEPQFYLGYDEEEQIDYGLAPEGSWQLLRTLRSEIKAAGGQRRLARESGVSRQTISRLMSGKKIRSGIVAKIRRALINH
jgi:hypothetical protein